MEKVNSFLHYFFSLFCRLFAIFICKALFFFQADKQQHNNMNDKKHLKKYQWKKGQSGNPNGRPKKDFALNEHIRAFANLEDDEKKTMLESVVEKVYEEALSGNMQAITFLADRILGKPTQALNVKAESNEPIQVLQIGKANGKDQGPEKE